LIARRIPLFEFAIRSKLKEHNLELPEGRVAALAQTIPMIARIRDTSLRPEYARSLAKWIGVEIEQVTSALKSATTRTQQSPPDLSSERKSNWRPDPEDPRLALEREVLKIRLQMPGYARDWRMLESNAFTHPAYQRLRLFIDDQKDFEPVTLTPDDAPELHSFVAELSSEPIHTEKENLERYVESIFARLRELALGRTIAEIKSKLQRINPLEEESAYNEIFHELMTIEKERRTLRDLAVREI
jgi:DNA primase